jgi:arylsulfatase A-like enzyme/Flp pilus assembly protein TadD
MVAAALALLAAGAGAFRGAEGPAVPPHHFAASTASAAVAARTAARRHSLVLITLDTTRADHLGAWGWPYAHTPNLDALAARGVRFVRCDTAAPITLPSHATLLTGLYPPRHGVRDNGTFMLTSRVTTLAERVSAHGYDTAAVVSAVVLASRHGLARGFRIYDDDLGAGYAAGTEVSERQAEATTAAALAVAVRLRLPFFLWVHYYDPHEEYRPPTRIADAATGPNRLYDGEIAYMDEQIGVLLRGLPKDADVVAVGDHGEMLSEHGELTHGLLLYSGARRVPLLLAGPDVPAGRTVDCLARTVDVAPTMMALAGLPADPVLDGRSLLPLPASGGTGCDRISYSESFLPFFAYKWYPPRALASDRFLYLQAPRSSLYQLSSDPGESTDLAASQPAALSAWRRRLVELIQGMGEKLDAEISPENVLSDAQRRQLASLGYLGGGAGGRIDARLPDPRQMTDVAQALHRATRAVQQGECAKALPELQAIVQHDPHDFPALTLAATCLEQTGRVESALALFQRAARENRLSAVPVANAAGCLLALNRREEATREYRHALALDPTQPESAANLARLLREGGDAREGIRVLDQALAAGSHGAEVFLERGMAMAAAGRLGDALRDFHEAARRRPADPVPLENAARAAYRLHRLREAIQLYDQLLRLAPGRLDLWKTAGAIYLYELEDKAEALRCFRRALSMESDPGERARLETLVRELGG